MLQWRFDLKSFARSSFSGVKSLPAESTNVNLGWFILLQTMGTPEIPNVSSHQHRSGKCWGRLVFTRFFPTSMIIGKEDQNGSKVRISGLQSQYTPFITR